MTKASCTFPALPHKSQDRTSNKAMTSSFHILCNSLYSTNLSSDYKQSRLLTTLLHLWVICCILTALGYWSPKCCQRLMIVRCWLMRCCHLMPTPGF